MSGTADSDAALDAELIDYLYRTLHSATGREKLRWVMDREWWGLVKRAAPDKTPGLFWTGARPELDPPLARLLDLPVQLREGAGSPRLEEIPGA